MGGCYQRTNSSESVSECLVLTKALLTDFVQKIVGHTAPPDFLAEMNKMALDHVSVEIGSM